MNFESRFKFQRVLHPKKKIEGTWQIVTKRVATSGFWSLDSKNGKLLLLRHCVYLFLVICNNCYCIIWSSCTCCNSYYLSTVSIQNLNPIKFKTSKFIIFLLEMEFVWIIKYRGFFYSKQIITVYYKVIIKLLKFILLSLTFLFN